MTARSTTLSSTASTCSSAWTWTWTTTSSASVITGTTLRSPTAAAFGDATLAAMAAGRVMAGAWVGAAAAMESVSRSNSSLPLRRSSSSMERRRTLLGLKGLMRLVFVGLAATRGGIYTGGGRKRKLNAGEILRDLERDPRLADRVKPSPGGSPGRSGRGSAGPAAQAGRSPPGFSCLAPRFRSSPPLSLTHTVCCLRIFFPFLFFSLG